MKRLLAVGLSVLLLTGCGRSDDALNRAMQLRQTLLDSDGCNFRVQLTADYSEQVYHFQMDCQADAQGNVSFKVIEPETISGITGVIDDAGGKLTFDDVMLAFPMLADGLVTPVSAPWLMIKTLRGGYITSAGMDSEDIHVIINDSYEEQALQLDFWLTAEAIPKRCEILWHGTRILSMDVEDFTIL